MVKLGDKTFEYHRSPVGILLERLCDQDFLYNKPFYTKRRGNRTDVELGPVYYNRDRFHLKFIIPQDREVPLEYRIPERTREVISLTPYNEDKNHEGQDIGYDRVITIDYNIPNQMARVSVRGLSSKIKRQVRTFQIRDRSDISPVTHYIRNLLVP